MTEKTIWREAYELLAPEGMWTKNVAIGYDRECYCAGSAIAKVLTGGAYNLYGNDIRVLDALTTFADHVGAPTERHSHLFMGMVGVPPAARVYDWNDAKERTHEDVLKAFKELHELEVASTT